MNGSRSRCALVAAVLGLTASAARPATAQSAVFHFSSKGGFASVGAQTVDPATGLVTLMEIDLDETTIHQPGGPPQTTFTALAVFVIFDPVTGTAIDSGGGELTVSDASLPTGKSSVRSASFDVSGVFTGSTGATYPVSADVTLTGTVAPVTGSFHSQFKLGGFIENDKLSGTFLVSPDIDVSGTISFDGLALGTIDFAVISYSKFFAVTISR